MKIVNYYKIFITTFTFMILIATNCASLELPEFFGVYANKKGILTEMTEHPNSSMAVSGIEIAGAGLMDSLSGVLFEDGKVEFIVFLNKVKIGGNVPVVKIDRIIVGKSKQEKYRVSKEKKMMRVAPISNSSSKKEMFRVVPKESLEPGIWAIIFENKLYDFVIKDKSYSDCTRRVVNSFAQIKYVPCNGEKSYDSQSTEKNIKITLINEFRKNDVVVEIDDKLRIRLYPSSRKIVELPADKKKIKIAIYKMSKYRKNRFSKAIKRKQFSVIDGKEINLSSLLR